MKSPGKLVTTSSGLKGRTYNSDHLVNGKLVVWLEDDEGLPIPDDKGNPKKLLVDRTKVRFRGFVD
jgi:hypothetical protein